MATYQLVYCRSQSGVSTTSSSKVVQFQERLISYSNEITSRTHGNIDGELLLSKFITHNKIVDCMKRKEPIIIEMCKEYGREDDNARQSLESVGVIVTPTSLANKQLGKFCQEISLKFVQFELNHLQYIELVMLHNAFQLSDPDKISLNDEDFLVIFEYLSHLLMIKKKLLLTNRNKNNLIHPNERGEDIIDYEEEEVESEGGSGSEDIDEDDLEISKEVTVEKEQVVNKAAIAKPFWDVSK